MHLCFVDESGTPAKPGSGNPKYFVIAGLIVPEDRWHRISGHLQGLKANRGYKGELKWRFFAPGNKDKENPMVEWTMEKRNAFRSLIFRILTSDKSIRIVAGICDSALAYSLPNVNTQADIYFRTYKVITERFQYALQDISKASGTKFHGIIVADHRGRDDDKRLREQHQRLVEADSSYTSNYPNLIEGVFLAPSHMSVGIQFADMVAGAIWRRFESNDDQWFNAIKDALRASPQGRIDGFGVCRFPKKGWTGPII
ncbi:DUF3800 domain-containing protein [Shinella yambaruensis]|uniref:DUF3800 domain-containing protein n=1 Tax=Shinella yambaruensis TaxID=415996 RepID=A0ABQ5ZEN9_9HYPH|nr:DUF3800 domain-containing protein [Shinella yambaruensis]MCJ8028716.1 DUF3800 domain-containing protein [Shinella yambaruensis]MCU7983965.1 DUF3800 domain-containing protein [Shinella yambaruensis]GLR49916.1 hypothetical protein GCM10007923_11210 [Shinella yambaruensis]